MAYFKELVAIRSKMIFDDRDEDDSGEEKGGMHLLGNYHHAF